MISPPSRSISWEALLQILAILFVGYMVGFLVAKWLYACPEEVIEMVQFVDRAKPHRL